MCAALTANSWHQDLQQLLLQGVLAGYALVTQQQQCESAHGLLSSAKDTLADQHFGNIFESEQPAGAVHILGHKAIVYRQTPCDVYAISRQKLLGVCISNLPFGVLITVFQKPQLPQTVVPLLEKFCAKLRA